MIAGLDASGAVQSLYPSYNKKKVSKVKRVKSGSSFASEATAKKENENTIDDTITAAMQTALAEETEGLETIQYDSSNPYAAAKKTRDQSLLLGMNIDEKA